ncbi:MAG: HugZ family protein [Burkholderiales bacterium]|nr:MAG: HugZ family protein [Burkholderiales bacterium]
MSDEPTPTPSAFPSASVPASASSSPDRPRIDPVRPADDEARALARGLLDGARFGALATLEPDTGHPLASRVAVALDDDGAPLLLMSSLSAHSGALDADPRCSLLVGEPGAGDPLAHPRLTVNGVARRLVRDTDDGRRARDRWLATHPRAALYVDFGDFAFRRIECTGASLNGGFGRAWRLEAADLRPAPGDVLSGSPAA